MANALIFGAGNATCAAYRYSVSNVADAGSPVLLRATTAIFAPNGWWQEALHRVLTLVVSANVGVTLRVTPILEGLPLDGTAGRPDARVTFTLDVPDAGGQRVTQKVNVGLYQPVRVFGTVTGRTGLRGTWVQFLVESIGPIVLPSVTESTPDLRLEGPELEWEPLLGRQQVVNAS